MTDKERILARHFGKLAVALATLFISGQAFAHGHHSHGKPLTEVEKKAESGVFDDKDVKDRNLADWEGVWQSVYPYLLNGDLDPVFKKKAEQDKSKTFEEVKAYYRKGYATDVDTIGIENGVMEFHRGDHGQLADLLPIPTADQRSRGRDAASLMPLTCNHKPACVGLCSGKRPDLQVIVRHCHFK